jgi:DNA helicase-2/ATP-dependent DNA helicase PcrA
VKLILEFEKTYPDAQIVRLEQNYRSTQNILDAAYGVISNNLGRAEKRLWSEENGGEKLVVHGSLNAQEEALWVVRQIEMLRRAEHLDAKDFAILCRVNAQSRPFEEAFMRARMPLKLVGTQRFYERREIRDVLAYLKFLYNPDDGVALTRLINVPPRGIGAATISKLEDLARQTGTFARRDLARFRNRLSCSRPPWRAKSRRFVDC